MEFRLGLLRKMGLLKMLKFLNVLLATIVLLTLDIHKNILYSETYGLGRIATPEEIQAWDIDIRPDGRGLPMGSGTVLEGEEVYSNQCAACHGDFGEAIDRWPELAGGFDTLESHDPVKTIGSYWPYLSTVWDYVHRAMPFGNAQSLTDDEVYSITAYILYLNDLVDEDFELSSENFSNTRLPNENNFSVDDRIEVEHAIFNDSCMSDCKTSVMITARALILDVTPEDEIELETELEVQQEQKDFDPKLVALGEKVFKKCKVCHKVGDKAVNGTGPHLNNLMGRVGGGLDTYGKYSKSLKTAGKEGLVWNIENLNAYLENPKKFVKGTRMNFRGLKKEGDRSALIEYLLSQPIQ